MSELEDKLGGLEKFDFSSAEQFDLNSNFEMVRDLKIERENLKQFEAENIIKEIAPKYVDAETITEFDNRKENLRNLMRRFGADKEELQKMSNDNGGERDKLYDVANFLYNKFIAYLNDINYNVNFTWEEFDFIIKTLNNKLEYDKDEVFQLQRLKKDFLDNAIVDFKKVGKDESYYVSMKMSSVVLLYHLLSKYKAHGIGRPYELFINLLIKIGEANQIFNALNIIKERLNTELQQWTTSITPDQVVESAKVEKVK